MARTIQIKAAVERYLKERRPDVSDSTLYNHSSQLKQFIEWCEASDDRPTNVGDIDGWVVSDFKMDRREDLSDTSIYNQMSVIRLFTKWCESRGLLEDVSQNILMPEIEDGAKEELLDPDKARQILEYLEKYEYASLRHALFAVLWTTGLRIGAVNSLDVSDYHSDGRYLNVAHRPSNGTNLKNKYEGEREVNLHDWVCEIVEDYIEAKRTDAVDDFGRSPLFSTDQGRAHRTTLRKKITTLTRPCVYTNDCPHDRVIEECEATEYNNACKCPSSVSPHPLRRSAITNFLNQGHSKELVSDRMDVSVSVIEAHYDGRTEDEKRKVRREMFEME